MASFLYRCNALNYQVIQPDFIPEVHYPAFRSPQIEITVYVNLVIVHRDYDTARLTGHSYHFVQETISFDLRLLEDGVQGYGIVAGMLTRLKIDSDSLISDSFLTFDDIVYDIIQRGLSIGDSTSNGGRMVLPLRAVIWGTFDELENDDEIVFIREATEDSALAINYGMVPAEESSVKKMLKKVKVKGEGCVICLEEINSGSDASQMPCFHIFHGACIEQWLKQSHYCPMCRFEMPVSES